MKLAIDLGGTNLRIAKIEDNLIVATKSVECPAQGDESVILDLIKAMIREFISPDVDGIGIGVPSIVDAEKGIVYDVANIPSCMGNVRKGADNELSLQLVRNSG